MRNARGHELEDSLFGILVFLCTLIRRFEETSACIRTHDSQFSRQAPTLPNVQYYIHEVFFLSIEFFSQWNISVKRKNMSIDRKDIVLREPFVHGDVFVH